MSFAPTRPMARFAPAVLALGAGLILSVGAALAQDMPALRPGLWEMNRDAGDGSPQGNRMTLCVDASLQKEMFEMGAGAMKGMCSRHEFHFAGKRGKGDFVCDMGGSRMHSTSTMVVEGDSAYRTEIHTTWDPPFMGRTTSDTVLTARRLGPCAPGQRPGDATTPQGHTFNLRDAMHGTAPPPR